MLKKDFVCVTINCHNGTTEDGAKGEFVASLHCTQGNYMHIATADGQLLAEGELGTVNADVGGALTRALKKWRALPDSERKPGAIKLPPPTATSEDELIKPPPKGLILRIYQRPLKRDDKGEIARITKQDVKNRQWFPDENWQWAGAAMTQPMPDVMWLTEAEWKELVPPKPMVGDRFDVPAPIRMRLFRNHLINGTTGLPFERWALSQVLRGQLTLTVEVVSPVLRLRLRGSALIATEEDLTKAVRGYDTKLTGLLEYDPVKKAFSRFDIVSVGDWWGGDQYENRLARPGKTPFGIALELAQGDKASDFVPPNGTGFKSRAAGYFAANKE
jgi:hypothetical protein